MCWKNFHPYCLAWVTLSKSAGHRHMDLFLDVPSYWAYIMCQGVLYIYNKTRCRTAKNLFFFCKISLTVLDFYMILRSDCSFLQRDHWDWLTLEISLESYFYGIISPNTSIWNVFTFTQVFFVYFFKTNVSVHVCMYMWECGICPCMCTEASRGCLGSCSISLF